MPFDKATEKFQRAVDGLKLDGRPLHNDDNVDSIWPKIICSDLRPYVNVTIAIFPRKQELAKLS